MRLIPFAIVLLSALPAVAADGPWTPAPTPNVGVTDNVMPAARAGAATGSARDAPFSSIPLGSVAADGATSSNQVNGVQAPDPSLK